jgi:Asp-tRNA(Asn)/Glu-tRNA(Gln) amidotransferase A subunit family amidase
VRGSPRNDRWANLSKGKARMTHPLTATAIAEAVRSGELTALLSVEVALARITAMQPSLNCFTDVYAEEARADAASLDALSVERRAALSLAGVPVAIKDFTPIAGKRTTFGSTVFRNHVASTSPALVRRLRAAGAIIIGHTTTPEFAHSSFTKSTLWGVTRNPWNLERTPGGSSGGSAAAVASGCVPLAEGTDMGGSIRIPAALCGLVGLKPSFGRIPMDMLRTQYDTLAHFGPLARTVDDAALFVSVTEGPDDADAWSLPRLPRVFPIPRTPKRLRLAVSTDLDFYAPTDDIADLFESTLVDLAAAGAEIVRVKTPFTRQCVDDWMALWAYTFAGDFGHLLKEHRGELDPVVVKLIEAGHRLRAVDMRAVEHRRTSLWRNFASLLERFDAFLCPTTCMTAPAAALSDPEVDSVMADGRLRTLDMTVPFNMTSACPVVSVPMGLAADGLPGGMQIVARRHEDRAVLAIAKWIGIVRPWTYSPPLAVEPLAS